MLVAATPQDPENVGVGGVPFGGTALGLLPVRPG